MEIDVTKRINPIARAVIIKDGYILLSSATKSNERFAGDLHFLPGGHVEHGESARNAIIREMDEEIENGVMTITNFLGLLECVWDNKGKLYHEVNFVFEGNLLNSSIDNPPVAKEPHIQFDWYKLEDLEKLNLLPKSFVKLIPNWLRENRDNNSLLQTEM